MARAKLNDTRVNLVISTKLLDVVKRFAEIRHVSVAQIFRESVRDYVRQEAEKEKAKRAAAQPQRTAAAQTAQH